jgi:phosphoserine phosphatase
MPRANRKLETATQCSSALPTLRLAVFDLDGTLKEAYSPWRYLHEALGVEQQAASYRERFFQGQIDYLEWARLDAALWTGVELSRVEAIFHDSRYRPGVQELFALLQRHHVLTAIVSTGLDVQARQVATDLGIWRVVTNELVVRDGLLTGEATVLVTEDTKGEAMALLRKEAGAQAEECLAMGDGPADIQLFAQASLAVAVCPRDEQVRQAAHVVIEDGDLGAVIPLVKQHFDLSCPLVGAPVCTVVADSLLSKEH